ncbi:MAG: hypothetical protein ACI9OJ_001916 [Myxococcota bacterium]|jgi:hypothetical protein
MKKLALCVAILFFAPTMSHADDSGAKPADSQWFDGFSGMLMTSGYYMLNTATEPGAYNSVGYPYTINQGFGLNFAGADLAYDAKHWGLTMNLRFGSGAAVLTGANPLKQGYATWKPMDGLTLDLGFFDTIYGAEVADEWQNLNFSRGALYFLRQPFNHMGLRVGAEVGSIGLNFLIANGNVGLTGVSTTASGGLGGQVTDVGNLPSLGFQVTASPTDDIFLAVGYLAGPNGNDGDDDWAHFIDVVNTYAFGGLSVVLNLDLTIDPEPVPGATDLGAVWGASLGLGYEFNKYWKLGLRGEYLGGNSASAEIDYLATATLSVRYSPVEFLTITVEPRADFADAEIFVGDGGATDSKAYFGIIVGATAHWGWDL